MFDGCKFRYPFASCIRLESSPNELCIFICLTKHLYQLSDGSRAMAALCCLSRVTSGVVKRQGLLLQARHPTNSHRHLKILFQIDHLLFYFKLETLQHAFCHQTDKRLGPMHQTCVTFPINLNWFTKFAKKTYSRSLFVNDSNRILLVLIQIASFDQRIEKIEVVKPITHIGRSASLQKHGYEMLN